MWYYWVKWDAMVFSEALAGNIMKVLFTICTERFPVCRGTVLLLSFWQNMHAQRTAVCNPIPVNRNASIRHTFWNWHFRMLLLLFTHTFLALPLLHWRKGSEPPLCHGWLALPPPGRSWKFCCLISEEAFLSLFLCMSLTESWYQQPPQGHPLILKKSKKKKKSSLKYQLSIFEMI